MILQLSISKSTIILLDKTVIADIIKVSNLIWTRRELVKIGLRTTNSQLSTLSSIWIIISTAINLSPVSFLNMHHYHNNYLGCLPRLSILFNHHNKPNLPIVLNNKKVKSKVIYLRGFDKGFILD